MVMCREEGYCDGGVVYCREKSGLGGGRNSVVANGDGVVQQSAALVLWRMVTKW